MYFLFPLLLATVLLASFEARRALDSEIGQRVSRAAAQLAPSFIAVVTFGVGATLVVSGAMPAFTDRLQILRVNVPLWAVETSHLFSSIAGLDLLFAARGLFHRLDGAWWLAFYHDRVKGLPGYHHPFPDKGCASTFRQHFHSHTHH